MMEALAASIATTVLLAIVAWLVRVPLARAIAEAVIAEQRRERERVAAAGRGRRPQEVFRSGMSGDDPVLEEERRVRAERERKAREFAGKLEAGRVVRAQRRGQV